MSRRKKTDKGQHFEELYLNERDKNVLLKRQNNEQADTIKRLYTKIRTCFFLKSAQLLFVVCVCPSFECRCCCGGLYNRPV